MCFTFFFKLRTTINLIENLALSNLKGIKAHTQVLKTLLENKISVLNKAKEENKQTYCTLLIELD